MDVNQPALTIIRFMRRVMWRERIKTLQGYLAIAMLAGGLAAAALVLYSRLRPVTFPAWTVALAVILFAFTLAAFIWLKRRPTERDAAFLIDDRLDLEDRVATSQGILERGGPRSDFESALIEDAAARVLGKNASAIAPYRVAPWHAVALVGIAALTVALGMPERSLPGGEELAEARADIQNAGEILEQSAAEIESNVAPETETAGLAKEQAELGRALRVSPETREEALKKLSALEQRIRRRHDELASTRADEIVSIAEQRIRAALSPRPSNRRSEVSSVDGSELAGESPASGDGRTGAEEKKSRPNARRANATTRENNTNTAAQVSSQSAPTASNRQPEGGQPQSRTAQSRTAQSQAQAGNANPQGRLQEPVSSQAQANSNSARAGDAQNNQQQPQGGSQAPGQDARAEKQPDNQPPDNQQQPQGGLTGMIAEQAAKAVPAMSEELLKKAQELRAGQMSAEDISRMAQMAEFLARDLSKIAESKELREAIEQLARQVSPEQIEQVARELMRNEQLRRELEASARMLMQNQQVREMVAGLARQFGPRGQQGHDGRGQNQTGEDNQSNEGAGSNRGEPGQAAGPRGDQATGANKLTGKGKEVKVGGNLQRKDGGEYLYLQTKAEAGAARAPYSSAYPQYRREAERSIQRSQVPPHMRSVVRKYFDAINPDAKKQP